MRLAESFGATGIRVTAPEALADAVGMAARAAGPTVVELEVPTGEMPMELYGPLHPPIRQAGRGGWSGAGS